MEMLRAGVTWLHILFAILLPVGQEVGKGCSCFPSVKQKTRKPGACWLQETMVGQQAQPTLVNL